MPDNHTHPTDASESEGGTPFSIFLVEAGVPWRTIRPLDLTTGTQTSNGRY